MTIGMRVALLDRIDHRFFVIESIEAEIMRKFVLSDAVVVTFSRRLTFQLALFQIAGILPTKLNRFRLVQPKG